MCYSKQLRSEKGMRGLMIFMEGICDVTQFAVLTNIRTTGATSDHEYHYKIVNTLVRVKNCFYNVYIWVVYLCEEAHL